MIPCLVVRGEVNALVLRKLLEPEFGRELRVLGTDYFSESVSLARSVLSNRKAIVALVVDTRSTELQRLRELHRFLVYALVQIESPDLWKVVLVVPDTETLLFQDRNVLRQVLGREPTEEEWTRGQSEPLRVLEEVFGLKEIRLDKELCRRLEPVDVSCLAGHFVVRQVREFFQAHREGRTTLVF
ncbi:hypothetical protein ATI61_104607 [Archangium gephyra]|uniref:Uncharacterized protein n=1 Tax=Archangium gephyra TaxID=48 RepID=A0AAC8Q3X6_9BACT|nr:hypothetical protein [Archangium gephyra]AKI99975.1 Hypothetical protein AA314_01602 [Archangium gephyra]REG33316.1 hypothetical protein ATI61_104607 [Archangium gephyra]